MQLNFIYKYFRHLLVLLIILLHWDVKAQEPSLTIDECYRLARENYPLIQKQDLIAKTSQYTISNAAKMYLPQVTFSGQATYQSQTISFPAALGGAPGISLPTISKDQYKIQGEVDQQLYDGGVSKYQKEYSKANEALQQQNLQVNLYALRDRINQIYFSVLLMEAQLKQNELSKADLQSEVNKTEAAYKNGIAYRSNVDELKAEIANSDMTSIEYKANRTAYLQLLSTFTGKTITESAQLVMPKPKINVPDINRPELKAYDLQKAAYDVQEKQLHTDYTPKFNVFFQGAYGRPTQNIIENQFGAWYVTGIKLSWSLGSLYTLKNNKKLIDLNRQTVDVDKTTFIYNTNLDLTQQNEDIKKYLQLIQQDNTAIQLRSSVKKSAEAQLANGVITVHDYISQSNAENLAKQSLILHHIQLLQAQYNYSNKSGN
jgi:outer membrane protein TolC